MKKLSIIAVLISLGAVPFGVAFRQAGRVEATHVAQSIRSAATANQLIELNATLRVLRDEIAERKMLLRASSSYPQIRADLLNLLDNPDFHKPAAFWAELRQELGIGWESSRDYVLVRKAVIPSIGFYAFSTSSSERSDYLEITEAASGVLAISTDEQSRIKQVIQELGRECRQASGLRIELNSESTNISGQEGDIMARLVIPPNSPQLEQGLSNRFTAEVTAVLGTERADKFLSEAWLGGIQPRLPLVKQTPLTLTIRRALVEGEMKLICEAQRGTLKSSQEIRYGRFPALWFRLLFPGGWRELAEYAHFELPSNFETGH